MPAATACAVQSPMNETSRSRRSAGIIAKASGVKTRPFASAFWTSFIAQCEPFALERKHATIESIELRIGLLLQCIKTLLNGTKRNGKRLNEVNCTELAKRPQRGAVAYNAFRSIQQRHRLAEDRLSRLDAVDEEVTVAQDVIQRLKELPPGPLRYEQHWQGATTIGHRQLASAMLDLERELVDKDPGKLNRKDWAGTKKGQRLSKRAQRACGRKK